MTKDEALKMAIKAMENSIVRCKDLHHAKKDQHKDSGQCPVEQRWNATIQACKEALEPQIELADTISVEDYQKLREQPTKEEILGKVFDAVYAQYQPKAETQEPVLYIDEGGLDGHATWAQATRCQATDIALYTHPKEWISLSDDEIWDIANFLGKNKEWDYPVMVAKTIEKALKEKNT